MNKRIFYAYSTHEDNQTNLYDGISNALNKPNDIEVFDADYKSGTFDLATQIYRMIDECDLFIADVTPESVIGEEPNKKFIFNSNVMLELGYALSSKNREQLLIIYNENNIKPEDMPFNIKNLHMKTYSILSPTDLADEIERFVNPQTSEIIQCLNALPKDDWEHKEYIWSSKFLLALATVMDIDYKMCILLCNKKLKEVTIWIGTIGKSRSIDVMNKQLSLLNGKCKDLHHIDDICNELKHIEYIAHLSWFK